MRDELSAIRAGRIHQILPRCGSWERLRLRKAGWNRSGERARRARGGEMTETEVLIFAAQKNNPAPPQA
jgi:hypothetical protein